MDDALEPIWNHEQVMENWEPGDDLLFEVWDKDFGKKDDFLGKCTLLATQFRDGFDGELTLMETGFVGRAHLRLRVVFGKLMHTKASIQDAAMAAAAKLDMAGVSKRAKIRQERLGIKGTVKKDVTRHQFREFLRVERSRLRYCATMPLTIILCATFVGVAYINSKVGSSQRVRSSVLQKLEGLSVPTPLPDGSYGPRSQFANISSSTEMWDWLREGLVPALGGSAERPGFLNSFNKAIGMLQLRQRRLALQACAGGSAMSPNLGSFAQLVCRVSGAPPSYSDPPKLAAAGTVDPAFVVGGSMPFSAKHGAILNNNYYYAFLNFSATEHAQERARFLQERGWCDESTEWLEAHVALFNGEVRAFTHVIVRFDFLEGGALKKEMHVLPVHIPDWTRAEIGYNVMWGLAVSCLFFITLQEVVDRKGYQHFRSRCCSGMWIKLDWLGSLINLGLIIVFSLMMQSINALSPEFQDLRDQELALWPPPSANATDTASASYEEAKRNFELSLLSLVEVLRIVIDMKQAFRILMFLYTFFLICRFFRGFLGQPVMASIVRTLLASAQDILHFAFMFAVILENFVLGGFLLFGAEVREWSSVNESHRSALAMITGFGDWDQLYRLYPVSATVWLFAFTVVIVFIATNMILAIMSDAYSEVRRNQCESNLTIFQQTQDLFVDVVWAGLYKARKVVRRVRTRFPATERWLPYLDEEPERVKVVDYDLLLDILKPAHEASGEAADVDQLSWARNLPDWMPMDKDILLAVGVDESTTRRLMFKCELHPVPGREFPTEALYFEFDGQMEKLYEQLKWTDGEVRQWLSDRLVHCENMEPRQRKLEQLAIKNIMPRYDANLQMNDPGPRREDPVDKEDEAYLQLPDASDPVPGAPAALAPLQGPQTYGPKSGDVVLPVRS
mmetsp:Transcript_67942/g.196711  ORF Transcript_67942/g.196711 Transcript_67942/m.196711 type:complete len:905 (+) Transcript_67942:3-2717(+)